MSLVIVPTPIGNLDDITFRAVQELKSADLVACEDTRVTRKLASRYGVTAPLTAYHEHNERTAAPRLLKRLLDGDTIALVSDAGTPLVSDPGYRLVKAAIDAGIDVIALPGPSAVITALSVSGLPVHAFSFLGYPPRKPGKLRNFLLKHASFDGTLIFFEAPRRVASLLSVAADVFGDVPGSLCREMTKLHEEVRRGPLSLLVASCRDNPPIGECTVLIAPHATGSFPASSEVSSVQGPSL
ncbi:MAG: 16S rRNA (cytidine(1402)-2'-O)-methyltransferase [Planctomycetes bacterium]|nr:16S rRNA (cytidine(1402)-2'-O)-methyltransferase [Planctomycetota bacterium]